MRKTTILCCLLLFISIFGHRALAQDAAKTPGAAKTPEAAKPPAAPAHYYHLDFVIQEVGADGKPVNSRSYSTTVSTDTRDRANSASIRTGSRIPIVTGAWSGASGSEKLQTQYQYLDVGVNIDVPNTEEVGRQLGLSLKAEVTSLPGSQSPTGPGDPVIHQNMWRATVLIPIGKPTVVFTSDALESKGGMQLVVTATPLQ